MERERQTVVFQLESEDEELYERAETAEPGRYYRRNFLYRPGPMDFIPQYIKGKEHPELITYDCPQLEPILSPTYGVSSIRSR